MSDRSSDLPDFHPTRPESLQHIPERFLVDGYLTLTATGQWLYKGEEVEHKGVQRFLSHQLQRNTEGDYWVVNGPQRVFVDLEGAPFHITSIVEEGKHLLATFRDGTTEALTFQTLTMDEEGILYTTVKQGLNGAEEGQGHIARLSRQAVYALAPFLHSHDEESGEFHLLWQGTEIPILPHPDPSHQ